MIRPQELRLLRFVSRICGVAMTFASAPGRNYQSRNNSLMPVFERVFSSTVFMMTAQ
jgi:hypothetical protein